MEEHGEQQNKKKGSTKGGKGNTGKDNASTASAKATSRARMDNTEKTQHTKTPQQVDFTSQDNMHKTLAKPPSFDTETEVSSISDGEEEKIKKEIKVVSKDHAPSENSSKRIKKSGRGVHISPSARSSEDTSPSKEEITKQYRRRDTPVIPHGSTMISEEAMSIIMLESDTAELLETGKESHPEKHKASQEATGKIGQSQPSPQINNMKSSSRNHGSQKYLSIKSTSLKKSITPGLKSSKSKVVENRSGSASGTHSLKRSSWSSEVTSKTEILPGSFQNYSSRESFGRGSPTVNPGEGKKSSLPNTPSKDVKETGNTQKTSTHPTKSSSEDKSRGSHTRNERGSIK